MLSISVNHPDVTEFVDIKANTDQITNANISIRVTDAFMQAVEKDEDYILRWPCNDFPEYDDDTMKEYLKDSPYDILSPIYIDGKPSGYIKKIKARDLFHKLAENNWDYGEPGILYWDRISKYHLMSEDSTFEYAGVNPCRPTCRA